MRTTIVAVLLLHLLMMTNSAVLILSAPEYCWRDIKSRGDGRLPNDCAKDKEKIGLLCYNQCSASMTRVGFDCHSVCPPGFTDQGLFCRLAEYGRGGGYPWKFGDGINDSGMIRRCEAANGAGNCEKNGLIYYTKCKPGYSSVGCCICRPNVPNCPSLGLLKGIDLSCAKKVTIGEPNPMICSSNEDTEVKLCYTHCASGFIGIGPVCWSVIPKGWVSCGMGAAKDSYICGPVISDQLSNVSTLALNVLTLGSSASVTKAVSTGKDAERQSNLTKTFVQLQFALKKADKVKTLVDKYANDNGDAGMQSDDVTEALSVDLADLTEEDIMRLSASVAAFADPTGTAKAVVSYSYSKCSELKV